MPQNLANANKSIEIVLLGVNWWGYKAYEEIKHVDY